MKKSVILTIILTIIAIVCPLNTQAASESQNVKKTKALFERFDKKMKEFIIAYQNDDEGASMEAFLEADDIASEISNMQKMLSASEIKQVETWMKTKSKRDPGFQERRELFNTLVDKLQDVYMK